METKKPRGKIQKTFYRKIIKTRMGKMVTIKENHGGIK
jgi:hypothetical protein